MGNDELDNELEAQMDASQEWMQDRDDRQAKIKEQLPPLVYEIFTSGWGSFLDETLMRTLDETGKDKEAYERYFDIFMNEPHK